MKVNILLIQENSVKDDYFLKILSDNLAVQDTKFLLLHEPVNQNKVETWFYTKRISAKLSESMVGNLPFSAEHKNLFFFESTLTPNKNLFYKSFEYLNALVINTVFRDKILEISDIIKSLKEVFEISNLIVFTHNALSPLGALEPVFLESNDKINYYQNIYPEEFKTLSLAQYLLPVFIANPQSFVKILKA